MLLYTFNPKSVGVVRFIHGQRYTVGRALLMMREAVTPSEASVKSQAVRQAAIRRERQGVRERKEDKRERGIG